ncbi:TPM domain-containing protein [Sphingomonas sp. ACRSK]|uniref:TPM domain-containing protein n=1 Tax=Sphingomonas sp. ACRSK TaxID=2918213 RepID=UPI001EF63D1F|nr:TPM domain-containing protein [Sphingomonas sp. ACRSK]MCG7347600.1 TPM domain-containing protein [Sphingomonas sp. ACRSK]
MKQLTLLMLALAAACSDGSAGNSSVEDSRSRQSPASAQPAVVLAGYVTDTARIIDATREEALSKRLYALEQATGHQMVIVTVPSLDGQDIADFTTALANAWGIGRAEHDDGVVLLVAPNERKVRIAVGYGLEKTLPDALCGHIIEEQMLPRFRQGDLATGIEAGATALINQLT